MNSNLIVHLLYIKEFWRTYLDFWPDTVATSEHSNHIRIPQVPIRIPDFDRTVSVQVVDFDRTICFDRSTKESNSDLNGQVAYDYRLFDRTTCIRVDFDRTINFIQIPELLSCKEWFHQLNCCAIKDWSVFDRTRSIRLGFFIGQVCTCLNFIYFFGYLFWSDNKEVVQGFDRIRGVQQLIV